MHGARARAPSRGVRRLALLLALACAVRLVHAAGPSVSYSTWIVSGDTVMLRFVLPVAEAERLTGAAVPVLTVGKLGQYVLDHTAVSSSGRDCPALDQGYDLGKVDPVRVAPGQYGFEILFRCDAPPSALVLVNHAVFDRLPAHVNFARLQVGSRFTDQLFTAGTQRLHIADLAAAPAAGLGGYVSLGLLHVLRDLSRLCFLVVAAVAARRPRETVRILAGLIAGYVLALAAQAAGVVASEEPLIEACIGFLIALCAVTTLTPQLERPRIATAGWPLLLLALAIIAAALRAPAPALLLAGGAVFSAGFMAAIRARLPQGARLPGGVMALPAAVFGFLDGFVLPSLLAPLGLPFSGRLRMSIGYDLGALLAEAGVLAVVAAALTLAGGGRFRIEGPLRDPGSSDLPALQGTLVEAIAVATFAGLGTFWLVIRLHP